MTKAKIHEYLMTMLVVVCIFVGTAVGGRYIPIAYAESDEDIQTRYEQTNVMSNLKGSTIGGKAFDIADYPHSETGKPQVISLVEFCYSYYKDKQSDYGLYVYVYNPRDTAIDISTDRNKIQLTYGDKAEYEKYALEFLNYSKDVGAEGRFWKYKVKLSTAERADVLKTLKPDGRIYKVSGIELSVKGEVTEYPCAQEYTYKGYAEGYGSELADSDTLSCTVDGLDKYLSLDVKSTYWRPNGTHEDKITRDTLHSVYFSVPDEITAEYGEMTGVHATWLNAYTKPIFVTGNKDIYLQAEKVIGKEILGGDLDNYEDNAFGYSLLALDAPNPTSTELWRNYSGLHYGYNVFEMQSKHTVGGDMHYVHHNIKKLMPTLDYLFYAENGDADTYTLPAEKLIGDKDKGIAGWFETYTEKYGGELVNDRYSKNLFEKTDDEFTDVNIRATDGYKLQDKIYSYDFWDILFGKHLQQENSYEMQAIQKVTVKDISETADEAIFCDKFYIEDSDYDEFVNYVRASAAKNETTYLFRYYQSEYVSAEVTEARRYYHDKAAFERCMFHSDCSFGHGYYDEIDTNAYFAQMWVQLDFDIIDLTFTKDDVITVIPVIMSPMDIVADADSPVYTTPVHEGLYWWQILLVVLILIALFILLVKFAPGVIVMAGKVLVLPFKGIGLIYKSIRDEIKPVHERNKARRKENGERRKAEREQEKREKRERKEREKKERAERKYAERKRRREEMAERKIQDRQERERIRQRDKNNRRAWKRHKKELRLESKSQKITQDIWSGKKTYAKLSKREKDLVDNHSPFTRMAREVEEWKREADEEDEW